ncbi:MAG: hypothetical protein MJ063_06125 [Lachnospiraceae bacterium]|nr:hypothetical protein [Lachnospiraceae bacterium]
MNVLWIISDNTKSANSKIAINLAKRMKNGHKVFCAVYSGDRQQDYSELEAVFEKVYTLGGYDSKGTQNLNTNSNWLEKSKLKKIVYLIQHAPLLFAQIRRRMGKSINKCRMQLESICKEIEADAIVAIVFPSELISIIPAANVVCKKMVVQLDPYINNALLSSIPREKKVRKEKDLLDSIEVLFTTDLIINELDQIDRFSAKVVPIEFPEIDDEIKTRNIKFTPLLQREADCVYLAYTGSLYKDLRNPIHLVNLLKELPQNYKLVLAGINTGMMREFDECIKDRIIDLGYISQDDVVRVLNDVDILICFNNAVSNQVPSKLFEYIETGKPFINLCQLKDCPSLPYVAGYENSINVYTESIDAKKVKSFIESHIGKIVPREDIIKKYYKNTIGYVEKQIEGEL